MGMVPRRSKRWAKAAAIALTAVAAVAAVACQPTRTVHGSYVAGTLTADGNDAYVITDRGSGFDVAAPSSNQGGNLRRAVVKADAPSSVDQTSCVTWTGAAGQSIQPGLSLRTRITSERTRAVTVTDNIVYGVRSAFNVHGFDSAASQPYVKYGSVSLPDSLGADPAHPAPLPWRMCARADGTRIDVKVWSTVTQPTEPAWGDTRFSGSVTVPQEWTAAGQPGVYVGHLEPGESTSYRSGATETGSPATFAAMAQGEG